MREAKIYRFYTKTGLKIFFILFIIHFSLFMFNVIAQSITWQRLYDGPAHQSDGASSVCKADNDNFYAVGYTLLSGSFSSKRFYILKLNPYGDTIWTRIIGTDSSNSPTALAVVSSGDGGCVFTGSLDSSFSIKLDVNGNIVWWKNYIDARITIFDIKKTNNGGYIACGGSINFDGYIFNINPDGNLIWQKFYPSMYYRVFKSIEIVNNSEYVLVGYIQNSSIDNAKGLITKINYSGDTLWNKAFIIDTITSAEKIIITNNGYLIGGYTRRIIQNFKRIFFVRTDYNFDIIYTKVFEFNKNELFYDAKQINSNKFVLSGKRDSNGSSIQNGLLRTFDSSGTVINEKILPSSNDIDLTSILTVSNGDIIFGGSASFNIGPGDVYIVRADSLLRVPDTIIGIKNISNEIPKKYKLHQNYPNPFNPITTIQFDVPPLEGVGLPGLDGGRNISLKIYDIIGKEVIILINEKLSPGSYEVKFDGTNFASGVYLYQLSVGDYVRTMKMVLLK